MKRKMMVCVISALSTIGRLCFLPLPFTYSVQPPWLAWAELGMDGSIPGGESRWTQSEAKATTTGSIRSGSGRRVYISGSEHTSSGCVTHCQPDRLCTRNGRLPANNWPMSAHSALGRRPACGARTCGFRLAGWLIKQITYRTHRSMRMARWLVLVIHCFAFVGLFLQFPTL